MSASSAIYEGWILHRRLRPLQHSFRYRIFMPLFDLAELPELLDPYPLWSARHPAPARFCRRDFLGEQPQTIAEAARSLVAERLGREVSGPIRLLGHPRYFGVGFNPVSFLFCHDRQERLDAVIAEVTNTPWRERHPYVLDFRRAARGPDGVFSGEFAKQLHVSPFMGMDQSYEWTISPPAERLHVGLRNREAGEVVFEASLALERREMTRRLMTRLLFTYPPMTMATLTRIYLNALKLRFKGAPYFAHSIPA